MSVHGRAAVEVGAVFERAGEVAGNSKALYLAPPLAGLWPFHLSRKHLARAEEIINELFNVARNLDNRDILLQAHSRTARYETPKITARSFCERPSRCGVV
jgi:hypothetical protein